MILGLGSGLVQEGLTWLGWLAAGAFLFGLPGWATLDGLHPEWAELQAAEKTGLAAGVSLALYPLLLLWTDVIGLHLGTGYALAPGLLAAAWLAWRGRHSRHVQWRRPTLAEIVTLAAIGLILATRILAVRGLAIPLWGDSYQHTVITQLIIDHGGLFSDWSPYAEMQSFTYHFGFHSAAAVFHGLTGVSAPRSVLVTGQILNVLAVLALYPLARQAYHSAWSGPAAVIVAGLLLWTPMIYTQWGRYTQLTGQAILPAAVCLVWTRLSRPGSPWKAWIPAGLTLAGLALTHYRVAIFAGIFVLVYGLVCFVRPAMGRFVGSHLRVRPGSGGSQLGPTLRMNYMRRSAPTGGEWGVLRRAVALGGGAALLILPWAGRVIGGGMWAGFTHQITTLPGQLGAFGRAYNAFGNLNTFLPGWVWPAAAVALAMALWRRQSGILLIFAWWALLLLATNPGWVRLPGSGVISNFAYWIAAYIPAAAILGAGAGLLIDIVQAGAAGSSRLARLSRAGAAAGLLALLVLMAWGANRRLSDLDIAGHMLVTSADRRAAQWIRDNTPASARFLVNSFAAYGGAVVAGSDAGWWLPLLAGRQTTQPPLNYSFERGPRPDYTAWVNALPNAIAARGISHPDVIALLQERQIDYVYIGAQQIPAEARLPVEALQADARFTPVYQQEGVWIFAFHPAP